MFLLGRKIVAYAILPASNQRVTIMYDILLGRETSPGSICLLPDDTVYNVNKRDLLTVRLSQLNALQCFNPMMPSS